ncbi:MAG: PPOX class F420-dependent oxidoreductase [Gordonia sp. (in: high G+C Gram-positive bacteria)]|uniref:pyridoxamine 5'-phosphate oxidase family protein n=1 Tax=Gordonia sp. (in: high G+C Gram-positive bacteria) TaxID=84139 RepID=UPI003BB4A759
MGSNQRSQIVMSDEEIVAFIHRSRTATLATVGATGQPHLVAMWFGVIDGAGAHRAGVSRTGVEALPELWFETKAKSQKAVNLRRDPRVTVMIEDGLTYDTLRGVAIEGTAAIYDDADSCLRTGISVWERYNGPYTDELRPAVDAMMHKRVAVRITPTRVRSWDHRKLNLPALPLSGSTAQHYS